MDPSEFTEIDYAWAAGFLDGEGCFTLSRINRARVHELTRDLNVSAAQVRRDPLDQLEQMFGGRVSRLGFTKGAGNEIWQWRVFGAAEIRRVLPLVIPYMRLKRREAEIVYEFARWVRRRGRAPAGTSYFSEDELASRRVLAEEMDRIRGRAA